jgi:hypothetical protein
VAQPSDRIGSSDNSVSRSTGKFLVYRNPSIFKGQIQYPDYWNKTENKNSVTFINSELKNVGVKLESIPSNNISSDLFATRQILLEK